MEVWRTEFSSFMAHVWSEDLLFLLWFEFGIEWQRLAAQTVFTEFLLFP